jgi:hypothetical protein
VDIGNLRQYHSGNFSDNAMLERFRGAFVHSDDVVEIEIPTINHSPGGRLGPARNPVVLSAEEWIVPFSVSDGSFTNNLFAIGMRPEAVEEKDRYDEFALPLLEGLSSFDLRLRELPQGVLAQDIVTTSGQYTWQGTLDTERGVRIFWDNATLQTDDEQLILEVSSVVGLVNMKTQNELFLPAGKHTLQFHFGNPDYINQQVLESEIRVGDVYPNPLSRATQVIQTPVSLPKEETYRFTLSDSYGKPVRQSNFKKHPSGRWNLSWEEEFRDLPAGVYFLQVEIGGQKFVRKVVMQ